MTRLSAALLHTEPTNGQTSATGLFASISKNIISYNIIGYFELKMQPFSF